MSRIVVMPILFAFLAGLGISLASTPLVRHVARRRGFVARPTEDRWHRQPTALLGGIGVFAATVAGAATAGLVHGPLAGLGATSAGMFVVGLLDDVLRLGPATKLALQIAAASGAVWGGITLGWSHSLTADALLTIFWLVGVTNAFNLVDNMDGACAGLGAIGAGVVAAMGLGFPGAGAEAAWAAALCGALVGFLWYNFHPASIFLGDSGSLFIGFLMAGLTALVHRPVGSVPFSLVALPVLVVAVPLFDTALVTFARKLSGRPASQGGTDHTAHRLVRLGLSETRAVVFLYGLSVASGVAAVAVLRGSTGWELLLLGLAFVLAILAVVLLGVRVYGGEDFSVVLGGPLRSLVVEFLFRHHFFEMLVDLALIATAYYTAYRIRFEGPEFAAFFFPTFLQTLPIVIACHSLSLLASGAYGRVWRYFSLPDLAPLLRGVALGTAASVILLVYLYRFENVSRGVLLIHAGLLGALLTTARVAFRVPPQLRPGPHGARRAIVYGAGAAGEMFVRDVTGSAACDYRVVGFLDDDPWLVGRRVRGLPVLGTHRALESLLANKRVDVVIVSSGRIETEALAAVRQACAAAGVPLVRFRWLLEAVVPGAKATEPADGLAAAAGAADRPRQAR